MSNWKLTKDSNIVFRINKDGSIDSCFKSVLPQNTIIDPADAPTQAELDSITRVAKDTQDIADAKMHAKLNALKAMSPAQVQAWVSSNVGNLPQVEDAIATLAIAVSILARRL